MHTVSNLQNPETGALRMESWKAWSQERGRLLSGCVLFISYSLSGERFQNELRGARLYYGTSYCNK